MLHTSGRGNLGCIFLCRAATSQGSRDISAVSGVPSGRRIQPLSVSAVLFLAPECLETLQWFIQPLCCCCCYTSESGPDEWRAVTPAHTHIQVYCRRQNRNTVFKWLKPVHSSAPSAQTKGEGWIGRWNSSKTRQTVVFSVLLAVWWTYPCRGTYSPSSKLTEVFTLLKQTRGPQFISGDWTELVVLCSTDIKSWFICWNIGDAQCIGSASLLHSSSWAIRKPELKYHYSVIQSVIWDCKWDFGSQWIMYK